MFYSGLGQVWVHKGFLSAYLSVSPRLLALAEEVMEGAGLVVTREADTRQTSFCFCKSPLPAPDRAARSLLRFCGQQQTLKPSLLRSCL